MIAEIDYRKKKREKMVNKFVISSHGAGYKEINEGK